jgi:hypothetical protein
VDEGLLKSVSETLHGNQLDFLDDYSPAGDGNNSFEEEDNQQTEEQKAG